MHGFKAVYSQFDNISTDSNFPCSFIQLLTLPWLHPRPYAWARTPPSEVFYCLNAQQRVTSLPLGQLSGQWCVIFESMGGVIKSQLNHWRQSQLQRHVCQNTQRWVSIIMMAIDTFQSKFSSVRVAFELQQHVQCETCVQSTLVRICIWVTTRKDMAPQITKARHPNYKSRGRISQQNNKTKPFLGQTE